MATHHSIVAWRIPRTEEPDGIQAMRSQSQTRRSNSTARATAALYGLPHKTRGHCSLYKCHIGTHETNQSVTSHVQMSF